MELNDYQELFRTPNRIYVWANSAAEISMPGDGIKRRWKHKPEELPDEIRELYMAYAGNNSGSANRYIVTVDGLNGVLLDLLYDAEEMITQYEKTIGQPLCAIDYCNSDIDEAINMMEDLLGQGIQKRLKNYTGTLLEGCDVFWGPFADPDGHNLAVFVPASQLHKLESIEKWLEENCYGEEDMAEILAHPLFAKEQTVQINKKRMALSQFLAFFDFSMEYLAETGNKIMRLSDNQAVVFGDYMGGILFNREDPLVLQKIVDRIDCFIDEELIEECRETLTDKHGLSYEEVHAMSRKEIVAQLEAHKEPVSSMVYAAIEPALLYLDDIQED